MKRCCCAAGRIRPLDNLYSPVGNWGFYRASMVDRSGNGFDLTVESGFELYSFFQPSLGGFLFNGSTSLIRSTFEPELSILGDMTALVLGILTTVPGAGADGAVLSHTASGETEATNANYSMQVAATKTELVYTHERDAGVNELLFPAGILTLAQPTLWGFVRESNTVQAYANGVNVDPPPTALQAPTGGSSGRFRIGGAPGLQFLRGTIACAAVYNRALTLAEMIERYNWTLGGVYGLKKL